MGHKETLKKKKESKERIFLLIYKSFIASSLGTATMVSVSIMSTKGRSCLIASFSDGASIIETAS